MALVWIQSLNGTSHRELSHIQPLNYSPKALCKNLGRAISGDCSLKCDKQRHAIHVHVSVLHLCLHHCLQSDHISSERQNSAFSNTLSYSSPLDSFSSRFRKFSVSVSHSLCEKCKRRDGKKKRNLTAHALKCVFPYYNVFDGIAVGNLMNEFRREIGRERSFTHGKRTHVASLRLAA